MDNNKLVTFWLQTLADGSTEIRGSDGRVWSADNEYVLAYVATNGPLEVRPYVAPAPGPGPSEKVLALRQAYRDATHALCALAGVTVKDKLEDSEYTAIATAAYAANPVASAIATDTMLYALSTLRLDDGRDAWDRI